MEYRCFGNTGFKVSLMSFGAGHIGSSDLNDNTAAKLLNAVVDMGINLIDTARSYGESERRIGQYLSYRRHDFLLSTKVGYTFQDKTDWSYDATMGTIDEALQILRTDYLDIVHLHSCDKWALEQGDSILALEKAQEQGKIRVIAYSGENQALAYAIESNRFDSIQCSVNIFDQQGIDHYLLQAHEKSMGVIAKRPLGNAVWRYKARPEGHSHVVYWDRFQNMKIDLCGMEWNELALRFTAYTPGIDTLIAGTSDIEHLKDNLRIVEKGPLEPEIYQKIKEEFGKYDEDWEGLI